jgi:hypothetical protein
MDKNTKHTLLIEYTQGLFATAVCEVLSFNEREIKLSLLNGVRLLVYGEKLKITAFDKGSGELKLTGVIFSTKYSSLATSKLKKLFG